jgi:energy-converting hydrogenase Eha subunit A
LAGARLRLEDFPTPPDAMGIAAIVIAVVGYVAAELWPGSEAGLRVVLALA